MIEKLQRHKISFDNITIVGDMVASQDRTMAILRENPLIDKMYLNSSSRFHYNYLLIGGGFIQFTHKTDKENLIRFEFNPNKIRIKYEKHYFNILKLINEPHLTRKDIAIDFFDEDLGSGWNFYDGLSRKTTIYKSGSGRLETIYFGSPKTDERIRIYNKALEQGERDKIHWRIEAQLRSKKANIKGYNPFIPLKIIRKGGYENFDVRTRAMLYYLENNPGAMAELSQNAKKKYKEILSNNVESVEFLIPFETENAESELDSWLNFTAKHTRLDLWKS